MSPERPVRLYLADDHSELLRLHRRIFQAAGGIEVVGQARETRSAIRQIGALRPDVVLLDVRMPPSGGLEVLRAIDLVRTRALLLSAFDLDEFVEPALRLGASGYLLKNAAPEELVAAVRAVARGHASLAPEITARLLDRLRPAGVPSPAGARGRPPHGDPFAAGAPTPRELEVIRLLARGRSNRRIAGELGLSVETVKTYLRRIFARYGFRDRTQLAVAAHEAGLLHEPRGEAPGRLPPSRRRRSIGSEP